MQYNVFWFRRDLRLEDNSGLFHGLKGGLQLMPVFIFDTDILNQIDTKKDKRVDLIHQRVVWLNAELQKQGSSLVVKFGRPKEVFKELCESGLLKAIYTNDDYEPQAIQRDQEVAELAAGYGVTFHSCKDQVIFAKNEVLKPDGKPYTVFTPYAKKWKSLLTDTFVNEYESTRFTDNFLPVDVQSLPTLEDLGFQKTNVSWPVESIDASTFVNYADTRNFPADEQGTSHLSVHLRFGTISIRKLVKQALKQSDVFLNELIWREFYMMILYHFPHVATKAFKPAYDTISWRNNETEFGQWCSGNTGYPLVDAGMRELNAKGLMHNRVRMVVASFLVKHLLIDWRWGEAYFAQKLLDYDLSANNGNWQWAAGCGCDAAPYFRVFNPTEQLKKFDAQLKYIRKWVPELDELNYAQPIVEHSFARNRVLEVFKKALNQDVEIKY